MTVNEGELKKFLDSLEGNRMTSMLSTKSATCYPQLPEQLTVQNSQKQKQTIAKLLVFVLPLKAWLENQLVSSRGAPNALTSF